MAVRRHIDNAASTLRAAIVANQTVLPVQVEDSAAFPLPLPNEFYSVTVEDRRSRTVEICHIVGRNGADLYVIRGQEGTAPLAFPVDSLVSCRATAASFDEAGSPITRLATLYLGVHPTAPTVGNSGEPLADGMWYVDNTNGLAHYYLNGQWRPIQQPVSSFRNKYVYRAPSGGLTAAGGPDLAGFTPMFTDDKEYELYYNGVRLIQDTSRGYGTWSLDLVNNRVMLSFTVPEDGYIVVVENTSGLHTNNPVGIAVNLLDDISDDFNGVRQSFPLQVSNSDINAGQVQSLFLIVDGALQRPRVDFSLAPPNTVTFLTPPAADCSFGGVWFEGVARSP